MSSPSASASASPSPSDPENNTLENTSPQDDNLVNNTNTEEPKDSSSPTSTQAPEQPSPEIKSQEPESPSEQQGDGTDNSNDEESAMFVESDTNDVEDELEPTASSSIDVDPVYDQTLLKPLFEQREKSLKELLDAMDEFSPIIPDAVTDHYLAKSGFKTTDHRIKRLLALATQKFIGDIASDAYQFSRIRAQTANSSGNAGRGRAGPGSSSGRVVLTMESLSGVLNEYGVNAERPEFYR